MDNDEKRIRRYENTLSLLFYEGEIAWQLNIVFIALNVGLGTLIGTQLKDGTFRFNILFAIYSLLGLVICILWLGTFKRNNKYYNFRMAQAREAEPQEWKLVRDRGYKFSHGQKIIIKCQDVDPKDQTHVLSKFEKWASNKFALKMVIYLLIGTYLLLLLSCLSNGMNIRVIASKSKCNIHSQTYCR
jgi:hypothetical protein